MLAFSYLKKSLLHMAFNSVFIMVQKFLYMIKELLRHKEDM